MPGFIPPQLATLRPKPPAGADWIHEIKFDGYRAQAHVSADGTKVYTRSGLNWTKRFPTIAAELAGAGIDQAVIDGEIVVVVGERTDFGALQADLAAGRYDRMLFYAFDLLHLDGHDLRKVPLRERKRLLQELMQRHKLAAPVLYSEHMDDGVSMFAGAERLNWEGIVSKRADAPYRSGDRSDSWQKIKTSKRETFPIVGFVPAMGGIAALHVARRDGNKLTYVGKVGTGFTMKVSADLRRRLDALPPPKTKLFAKKHIRAVEPTLVAHVEYRDITADGYLRHPSFKGLAED
ncbi:non-homologous end-joining DNA ligase [Bradyrhizobium sp. Bra64]|uniref:non-homologous end-joining DNA ligase n=1 Tax=Bradyrhizobium sp. Bra64 TaxID=2926009 RepID=UPI0021198847|nr:non-homologous end-joining DNA ligase [Bradyrhizobium sp. Bra64]